MYYVNGNYPAGTAHPILVPGMESEWVERCFGTYLALFNVL